MVRYANNPSSIERELKPLPRVVVAGLASCFGCQLQITNMEKHLTDVLGQIDLRYWQLASSAPMPDEFDVAIIEGAVTTEESRQTVLALRERAKTVIAIGACATTAGIPGLAASGFEGRVSQVYDGVPAASGEVISPVSVPSVIECDYTVLCCPIDFWTFTAVLEKALYGSNRLVPSRTMCGDCKRRETTCFYEKGEVCMGLVTTAGCGARCTALGRPCMGCAGLADDCNLAQARASVAAFGMDVAEFDKRLDLFNQTHPALAVKEG